MGGTSVLTFLVKVIFFDAYAEIVGVVVLLCVNCFKLSTIRKMLLIWIDPKLMRMLVIVKK